MIGCNRLMPCSIIRGVQRCTAREASGNVLRNKRRIDSFLTQGYQPTTEELMDFSNVGYDESVCMLQSHVHRCLPILDASVILSPGQYCKSTSKNGTIAAKRLVDGRRAFEEVITNEIIGSVNEDESINHQKKEKVHKLYALVGAGVPDSLLRHFISTGCEWLQCQNAFHLAPKSLYNSKSIIQPPQSTSAVHLSVRNICNTTTFDRERILKTNANGTTSLIQWPLEWEHDLELLIVVMNRIGSRLSSVVLRPSTDEFRNENDFGVGSIIKPCDLEKWNISIRKGSILPFYLLPSSNKLKDVPVLTIEWLCNSLDCCKIVLRLQSIDNQNGTRLSAPKTDPVTIIFEGVYVPNLR